MLQRSTCCGRVQAGRSRTPQQPLTCGRPTTNARCRQKATRLAHSKVGPTLRSGSASWARDVTGHAEAQRSAATQSLKRPSLLLLGTSEQPLPIPHPLPPIILMPGDIPRAQEVKRTPLLLMNISENWPRTYMRRTRPLPILMNMKTLNSTTGPLIHC